MYSTSQCQARVPSATSAWAFQVPAPLQLAPSLSVLLCTQALRLRETPPAEHATLALTLLSPRTRDQADCSETETGSWPGDGAAAVGAPRRKLRLSLVLPDTASTDTQGRPCLLPRFSRVRYRGPQPLPHDTDPDRQPLRSGPSRSSPLIPGRGIGDVETRAQALLSRRGLSDPGDGCRSSEVVIRTAA